MFSFDWLRKIVSNYVYAMNLLLILLMNSDDYMIIGTSVREKAL